MKIRTLLLLCILIITPITAVAIDSAEMKNKVANLNNQSLKSLGVSLNALLYLVDGSSNSYVPLWYLEKTGNIKFIRELESKGYVKVEVVTGLPDGQEKNQKFLRFKTIGRGLEIQGSIIALKNNK